MFRLKANNHLLPSREELFENQLTTLEKRSCPLSIIDAFNRSRKQILAYALSITVEESHIPFLPVIIPCYLGYHGLVAMVRHNRQDGTAQCEVNRISDLEKVPARLYYIFDVDIGLEYDNRAPEIIHTLISQNGRLPSTATETINLAIHADVLARHPLLAVGSGYESDRTPMIWLNVVLPDRGSMHPVRVGEDSTSLLKTELGKPGLGWWYSSSPCQGGAPSCASRLEI